jgi:hypothetical protein
MSNTPAYQYIIAESYIPKDRSGLRGLVHIRPAANQQFPQDLHIECSKRLMTDYPVGTRFRIRVKLTDRQGGNPFLYSYFGWPVEVLSEN